MSDILSTYSTKATPQSEQARRDQIRNAAGGYAFSVTDEARLHRFLTLGTEGGTFYTKARELTRDNAGIVLKFCETEEGAYHLINTLTEISRAGRAPKQQPAIFALALACAHAPTEDTRHLALRRIPEVCRTGSTLFTFLSYIENLRGWGKGLQRGVARWYFNRPVDALAYQMVKYRQRLDWKHRDALRLAHNHLRPKPAITPEREALLNWLCGRSNMEQGVEDYRALPPIVLDYEDAQRATYSSQVVDVIRRGHGLSWEMIPDQFLNEARVWEALIDNGLPATALMRQLPRLTRIGAVTDRLGSATTKAVCERLCDPSMLRRGRVHPINVLVALRTYEAGVSARGDTTWTPARKVIDALDAAFYAAYGAVEGSGKNIMLALDVSGSMGAPVSGMPLTCREAAAAMALVTAATEDNSQIIGFTGGPVPADYNGGKRGYPGARNYYSLPGGVDELSISPRMRLADAMAVIDRLPFGRTDCAQPMMYALKHRIPVDQFVILTDNETWCGPVHPHQALAEYRRVMKRDARLVVVAMTATGTSIADPFDPLQMDISGFDSTVPQAISDFAAGRL